MATVVSSPGPSSICNFHAEVGIEQFRPLLCILVERSVDDGVMDVEVDQEFVKFG